MSDTGNAPPGDSLQGLYNTVNEQTGSLSTFDSGAYLYQFSNGNFDVDKFNRDFDQYMNKRKYDRDQKQKLILDTLNKKPEEAPLYDQPLGKIMINTKDAVLGTVDDLLQGKFERDSFIKENRLFYLGVILICVAVFAYFYNILVGSFDKKVDATSLIQISFDKEKFMGLLRSS